MNFRLLLLSLILLISCKSETKTELKDLTIAEKIANAHGFEKWKDVSSIKFTFNVDADSTHFERKWLWKPKTNEVTLFKDSINTITYKRAAVDSLTTQTDASFINDKYWLLAPFNMVWDKGTTVSEPIKENAPVSKKTLNKITLTYTGKGGYTPGDAYDFYYNDDFIIQEWIFRKSNTPNPSMATTWEDYEDFNGLKIAKSHKKDGGNWNLNFTDIEVEF